MHASMFQDSVVILTAGAPNEDSPMGVVYDWDSASQEVSWACILEQPVKIVDYGQNESQRKLVKVILRGRFEIDVPATRIVWKGTVILQPISSSYLVSRSDTQFTILLCHQIDRLA